MSLATFQRQDSNSKKANNVFESIGLTFLSGLSVNARFCNLYVCPVNVILGC